MSESDPGGEVQEEGGEGGEMKEEEKSDQVENDQEKEGSQEEGGEEDKEDTKDDEKEIKEGNEAEEEGDDKDKGEDQEEEEGDDKDKGEDKEEEEGDDKDKGEDKEEEEEGEREVGADEENKEEEYDGEERNIEEGGDEEDEGEEVKEVGDMGGTEEEEDEGEGKGEIYDEEEGDIQRMEERGETGEDLEEEEEEGHIREREEREVDEEEIEGEEGDEEMEGEVAKTEKPKEKGKRKSVKLKVEKKGLDKKGIEKLRKESRGQMQDDESSEEDIYAGMSEGESEMKDEKKLSVVEEEEEEDYEDEEDEYGYISGPYLSDGCSVPEDVFVFYHSFGYDCKRHYNICVPDPKTVIFASGNYVNFFDIITKELTFQRSAKGGGIGHITKNPKYPHIAVAEKGLNPLIIIYEWPTMERIRVLRGGAKRAFSSLHYSPDGKLLCSQGCAPDHFLTVWNWRKGKILRQQRAYGEDVYNAMFSHYFEGSLTTGGYGHIKFWKLATTFTGLKLMGSIGRFGKTEMCDIIGFVELPDEKVISGCEWGNMLIWDEGLVKAEVCRKTAACHDGYISQLLYDDINEELITVGTDGFIRAWDYKLIEKADLIGDSPKIKLEYLYAWEIGKENDKSQLLYIEKQDPKSEKNNWFAQDGNGGIWLVDMDQDHPKPPEKLFRCHAGGVRSIAVCPYDSYVASYGDDGRIIFYNYKTKKTVLVHKFAAGGGFMLWPDLTIDETGDVIICGGADGLVRVAVVALQNRERAGLNAEDSEFICLIQTTKPHTMRITHMIICEGVNNILVTGSEDSTIFIYQILQRNDYVSLNPIGFVRVPSAVTHILWKDDEEEPFITVSCFGGEVALMKIPDVPQIDTKISYELTSVQTKIINFLSVKSQIRRDIIVDEDAKRRQEKLEMKKEKLAQMRKDNPNLKIDDEIYLEDSESSISLESLYFPEVPNPILFSMFLAPDILWLSPAGYDAGYVYEYTPTIDDPVRCTLIPDADDIEIHCFCYDPTGEYLIMGMQDGKIRVNRINQDDISDFSDYWALSVHDNETGIISQMCFSHDSKYFFTCGRDGNVFAFTVCYEMSRLSRPKHKKSAAWPSDALEDIDDPAMYSLEQLKQKADYDKKMKLANEHKEHVLEELKKLKEKFVDLLRSNKTLPAKMRIPYGEFKVDPRIEEDLEEELEDKMNLEKRKLAFLEEKSDIALKKLQDYYYNILDSQLVTVIGVKNPKLKCTTFRSRILPHDFFEAKRFVHQKLNLADQLHRPPPRRSSKFHPSRVFKKPLQLASWLKGIGTIGANVTMNNKLQRMLLKYYERKRGAEIREEQWKLMKQMKPDPKVSHPDDVAAIEHAERTIGDYKMKTDPNYTIMQEIRMTTDKKYNQLLETRQKIFTLQKDYNNRVYRLRDKKVAMIEHITDLHEQLKKRHKEMPLADIKRPPPIPKIFPELEFPEEECMLQEEDVLAHYPTSVSVRLSSRITHVAIEDMVEGLVDKTGEEDEDNDSEDFVLRAQMQGWRARPRRSVHIQRLDKDYEILLRDTDAPAPKKTRRSLSGLRKGNPRPKLDPQNFCSDIDIHRFVFKSREDDKDTPWEKEMGYRRLCRSRYIQDKILKEIDDIEEEFDKELTEVKDTRFEVAVDIKFGDLHLLKQHQELIILKEFEAVEDRLALRVANTEDEIAGISMEISDINMEIEMHKKEIENLAAEVQQLGVLFLEKIEGNSYIDFLKKIYKKKYKPPKEKHDDDESESESSSESSEESEEEDEGSIDSQDMGVIKLDETICPPDLEREIYDMTFEMRSQRHQLEIKDSEERRDIEILKKEIERKRKVIKTLEKNLKTQKDELLAHQREKQHRLNEVMCVVALKASQMQYFEDPNANMSSMDDKLVFSQELLVTLTKRVDELWKETQLQENKFRRYKHHHKRMNIDCRQMRKNIAELKMEIRTELIKKFGSVIDLEDLEDIILQRLILELKSTLRDITKEFQRVASILKEEIRKRYQQLTEVYRSNAEKMNVLALLEHEKTILSKLSVPDETKKITYKDLFRFSEELKKLRRVIINQKTQIDALKEEIRNLGFKGKPLIPICTPEKLEEELARLQLLAAEAEKLPEIVDDEEEDENMFLYMESSEAVKLVTDQEDLRKGLVLQTAEEILDDLISKIDYAGDYPSTRILDSEIEKLVNRIPPTDIASGIYEEVSELLAIRLTKAEDPPRLKDVLMGIVHDMEGMPTDPADIKFLFKYVFKRLKEQEADVEFALQARAITYDALRKSIGFIQGKKFFLTTEEAILQVLSTLDEDSETRLLIEEVLLDLAAKLEDQHFHAEVEAVLEDIMHDLRSLQDAEHPKDLFRSIFKGFRERVGSEKNIIIARNILHDALKRAIATVAETSYPMHELSRLEPDAAILRVLEKLPPGEDMVELLDEIDVLLKMRDPGIDTPDTQPLLQTYTNDINEREDLKTDDAKPFYEDELNKMASSGVSKKDLFWVQSVICDTLVRAIFFIFPDVELEKDVLEPGAGILSMLDKISCDRDTSKLFEDIIEELTEKNKTELLSENVQVILPETINVLEGVQDKQSGIKNTFANIIDDVKAKKVLKLNILCVLKMLEDAIRNTLHVRFPDLFVENEEEVKETEKYILKFLEYLKPKDDTPWFHELMNIMNSWETKTSDLTEIGTILKEIVENLLQALRDKMIRKKKAISFVFKMIYAKGQTKPIVLRLLYILKFCVKAAIRNVRPDIDLEDEECHFDPDETTIPMLQKVPGNSDAMSINEKINTIISSLLRKESICNAIKTVLRQIQSGVSSFGSEQEDRNIAEVFQEALKDAKDLDVPKVDNIYARIYINDIVHRVMSQVLPRTDIKEANCSMDKERPTIIMLQKIPLTDEIVTLFYDIREEMETCYETIENDPEVQNAIHDVIMMLFVQPPDQETSLQIINEMFMKLRLREMSRLAALTAKHIFYKVVKKCIEVIFPYIDLDDAIAIDKEWPIIQMIGQLPYKRHYVELMQEIIKELQCEEEETPEGIEKDMLSTFISDLSGRPLQTGNVLLVRECFHRIKSWEAPVKYFKPFKEKAYRAIKRAIQKIYPEIDLQDNQTSLEHEEDIMNKVAQLPTSDDTALIIDEFRERLDILKATSREITEGLRTILTEIEHHTAVLPIEEGEFEDHVCCLFTILMARKGDKKDIAKARTMVYKAIKDSVGMVYDRLTEQTPSTPTPSTPKK